MRDLNTFHDYRMFVFYDEEREIINATCSKPGIAIAFALVNGPDIHAVLVDGEDVSEEFALKVMQRAFRESARDLPDEEISAFPLIAKHVAEHIRLELQCERAREEARGSGERHIAPPVTSIAGVLS